MDLKYKQICRFCLSTTRPLVNIYKTMRQDIPLSLQIVACVSIEVFPRDKMPTTICDLCASIMEYIYAFKDMCREADTALKLVPTTNVWPDCLSLPQFAADSRLQLVLKSDEFINDIFEGAVEHDPEEDVVDESHLTYDGKAEQHVEPKMSISYPPEPIVEVSIPTVVPGPTPKKTPRAPVKQKQQQSAPKVLNRTKRALKCATLRQDDANIKRNKFGNVDIVMDRPEVLQTDVFSCTHCNRSFPLIQLLEIHERNHVRERDSACELCPKKFFSKYDLAKHMNTHTGEKPFECVVCNKAFSRSTLLHRHQKTHVDVPRLDCDLCDRFFFSKDDLDKHAQKHLTKRPFQCSYCLKSFAFKQGLERHEVVHSESQPFPCQYCEASFNTRNKLLRHLTGHAGDRPYPCKFCHKSYLMSHHLTRHMRSHAVLENITVTYKCNLCQQTYDSLDELVDHMDQHNQMDDYRCPLCEERFATVEENLEHIHLHAQGDQFACEFCDLMFVEEDKLILHSQSHHAEDIRIYDEDVARNVKSKGSSTTAGESTSSSKKRRRNAKKRSESHRVFVITADGIKMEVTGDADQLNQTNISNALPKSMSMKKAKLERSPSPVAGTMRSTRRVKKSKAKK